MATDFLRLAKEAYESSSAYLESNYRQDWDYSLRAFRNEHASGSKYLSADYAGRSKLYRPKTRSIIRKNEAAAAAALFSNNEVVNTLPGNPNNVMSVAASAAMKEVLEYRLTKTIKAFPLVMGAYQDAQAQGVVVSYQYWEYETRKGKKTKDKPCIVLRPVENIRLDGGADWLDPVNTSPYWCDIIPMYVCDVRAMMLATTETNEPKWKKYEDSVILRARPDIMNSLTQARSGKQQEPSLQNAAVKDFDTVWVMRWFMKDSIGDDYTYYTLGTEELLCAPKPLEEVYFHGVRPYVMGYAIVETHRPIKTSLPTLIKPLQQETNQLQNARLDNVQFVLNKRWIVARGRQVDVQSLVRNVPGGVTLATDPKSDVHESNWPDVTSSAYVEQDRINSDLDDLAGNFSPSTKVANNAINDTLGGSKMAAMGAGLISDYSLRTFIETWYEPVLRQLVLLEKEYETDEVILGICAEKAKLFPKFGISAINDVLLKEEMDVTVNVGMGATNPNERFQKLIVGTEQVMKVLSIAPPNFNAQEFIKESYSNMGYRDGTRFWGDQADPRLAKAMQLLQQLQGAVKSKQMELAAERDRDAMKIASTERIKLAELHVDAARISGDIRIRESEVAVEQARLALEAFIAKLEAQGMQQEQIAELMQTAAAVHQAHAKLQEQRIKVHGTVLKLAGDLTKRSEKTIEAE